MRNALIGVAISSTILIGNSSIGSTILMTRKRTRSKSRGGEPGTHTGKRYNTCTWYRKDSTCFVSTLENFCFYV